MSQHNGPEQYFILESSRKNKAAASFNNFFYKNSSYFKLMLEVMVRKNFGHRYFNLASVFTVATVLFILPFIFDGSLIGLLGMNERYWLYNHRDIGWWTPYTTWYIYIFLFLYFSFKRKAEISKQLSAERSPKSAGDIHPWFLNLRVFGKRVSHKSIQTFYEPAFFFLIGLALWMVGQKLGILLIISSMMYGLSYRAAIAMGAEIIAEKAAVYFSEVNIGNALIQKLGRGKTADAAPRAELPESKKQADVPGAPSGGEDAFAVAS